jgi:NADH-quinone oxidoreductase subunit F
MSGMSNIGGGKSCKITGAGLPEVPEAAFIGGSACVVDYCKELMDTARRESCGKCVLCREGTWQVYEIMKEITEGKAKNDDLELLAELLEEIERNGGCEMSEKAASLCLGLLRNYQEEWDQHIRRNRCSNLICKASFTVYILHDLCDGCGHCFTACPEEAVLGGTNLIHVINGEKCSKCMLCSDVCPKGAVKKAGAIKPKVPAEPVPVGSFGKVGGGSEDGTVMRRRRRGE